MNRSVAAAWVALLTTASGAQAQVVRGVLVDAGSSDAIVGGLVSLVDLSGTTVATVATDGRGEFFLRAPTAGDFRIVGTSLGYATASAMIALEERIVIDVAFRLSVDAVVLEPITVEARRDITPGSILHAERRARGLGVFLSQEDVLSRTPLDLRDVLVDVDGLQVKPGRGGRGCGLGRAEGAGIALWDGNCLVSNMGWGCMVVMVNELPVPEGFDLTDVMPRPHQTSAVEVYRTYQEVPEEHKLRAWPPDRRTPCGLVAIWTHAAW